MTVAPPLPSTPAASIAASVPRAAAAPILPSAPSLPAGPVDAKTFEYGAVVWLVINLFPLRMLLVLIASGVFWWDLPNLAFAGIWNLPLVYLLPLACLLLFYHYQHFRLLDRKPLLARVRDGLAFPGHSSRATAVAAALGCALAAVIVGSAHLAHFGNDASQTLVANLLSTGRGKAILLALLILLPLLEEGFFRGCVFPYLRAKTGAFAACLLVALLCGLCLLPQFPGYWYWVGVPLLIALTAMHLVLTVERHVFDSVTPPLVTHAVCNLGLAVLVVLA